MNNLCVYNFENECQLVFIRVNDGGVCLSQGMTYEQVLREYCDTVDVVDKG